MTSRPFLPVILFALVLTICSCSGGGSGRYQSAAPGESMSVADSATSSEGVADNTANGGGKVAPVNDPSRKIIRTADLRCRVNDVFTATTHIEHLTHAAGGSIADSRMENSSDDTRFIPYGGDSLRRIESYTTTAHLSLRIPVQELDSVLADIAGSASFINSRNLHLDDATLRYLANKLKGEALAANDAALRARALARKSAEAIRSGSYTDEHANTSIDRRIENMQLDENAAYATLTVDLYQPQRLTQSMVPNVEALMKPGISQQIAIAGAGGWRMLQAIFIGLLSVWPLFLLLVAGIFFYRRLRRPRTRVA